MRGFFIFLAVILVLGVIVYYSIVNTTANAQGEGGGSEQAPPRPNTSGTGIATPDTTATPVSLPMSLHSTKVSGGSIIVPTKSLSAFFIGISEANLSSFNILGSPVSNPELIHYETSFNSQCPQYVWYNRSLYALRGTDVNSTTGVKTCYYKNAQSSLPSELKVQTTAIAGQCANFKLYLSGVEYRYTKSSTETIYNPFATTVNYCVYQKQ